MLDNKLYTFLKVLELGSISKAAAELNLTQPAVSQQIKHLEEELGATLLIRKRGTLVLTPRGEIARRYARNLLKAYHGMFAEFDEVEKEYRHVIIGVTPVAQGHPIVDVIARYSAERKNLKITMYEQLPDSICNLVQTDTLSWGILDSPPSSAMLKEDLKLIKLDTDTLVCVMSPTHPLAQERDIPLSVFCREPVVLPLPKYTTTEQFTEALRHEDIRVSDLNVILETDDLTALKKYAAEGLGISILPSVCCREEQQSGKLVLRPIRGLDIRSTACIIYKESNHNLDILHTVVASPVRTDTL